MQEFQCSCLRVLNIFGAHLIKAMPNSNIQFSYFEARERPILLNKFGSLLLQMIDIFRFIFKLGF
jgi:hypothetical protein